MFLYGKNNFLKFRISPKNLKAPFNLMDAFLCLHAIFFFQKNKNQFFEKFVCLKN